MCFCVMVYCDLVFLCDVLMVLVEGDGEVGFCY